MPERSLKGGPADTLTHSALSLVNLSQPPFFHLENGAVVQILSKISFSFKTYYFSLVTDGLGGRL